MEFPPPTLRMCPSCENFMRVAWTHAISEDATHFTCLDCWATWKVTGLMVHEFMQRWHKP